MNDQINNTFMEARRGSIAAIIQIMNEHLAELDVRIRAIFSDGVLQVLCEASQVEQLEKSSICLLYTSPSPRDSRRSGMPSSA